MENNQTPEGQDQPPQIPPTPPPIEGNVGNGREEPPSTPPSSSNSQQPEHEPVQVTVNIETPQNNDGAEANQIARRANRLTVWSIGVNVILMVATFMLYMLTREATTAATKSANAADSTYQEQKRNDAILLYRDSIKNHDDSVNDAISTAKSDLKDSTNRADNKALFKLQKASTQAQIDAFKREENIYNSSNETHLDITRAILHIEEETYLGYLSFYIFNHNNKETLINSGRFALKIDNTRIGRDEIKNRLSLEQKITLSAYVSKEPQQLDFNLIFTKLSPDERKDILTEVKWFIVMVELNYISPVTGISKTFRFCGKIRGLKVQYYEPWENWTEDTKKH